eukprot:COSAG01_NODE_467_length_16597_cov_10.933446_20_plen_164_part_00
MLLLSRGPQSDTLLRYFDNALPFSVKVGGLVPNSGLLTVSGGGAEGPTEAEAAAVSRSCACIGSPCLRRCGHGASIGGGGCASVITGRGGRGRAAARRRRRRRRWPCGRGWRGAAGVSQRSPRPTDKNARTADKHAPQRHRGRHARVPGREGFWPGVRDHRMR